MNAIELLRKQQSDFIERLEYSCLLNCQIPGKNSEITVVLGRSKICKIVHFSYSMRQKYSSKDLRETFRNNYIGKLGEEAVKSRLDNFINEVDYKIVNDGDGKVDFKFAFDPSIRGIQVKTRNGSYDIVTWSITEKEIEANKFLVCMLIEENVEINEILKNKEPEYKIISADFMPMYLIKKDPKIELIKKNGKIEFTIYELLYISGLNAYLVYLKNLYDSQLAKLLEI